MEYSNQVRNFATILDMKSSQVTSAAYYLVASLTARKNGFYYML